MPHQPPRSEDELIAAALAAVDSPPPTPTGPRPAQSTSSPAADSAASPTLAGLAASRRPKAATVCERCPNSVWFASTTEVRCYCRVMFLVTWSSKEPNTLTACDGLFLGQE